MSDEKVINGGEEEILQDGNYFGKREENAISEYIACENPIEKQRIFNNILKPAFTKMIESLIRRYNLFTIDEPFEDTFNDTLSFLMLKINNFDAEKGYKAYSYCGTVCKNYLIRKRKESQKNESTNVSFNPTYGNGLSDEEETSEKVSERTLFNKKVMTKMSDAIHYQLDRREELNVTDEEYKVGIALLELLQNWENIIEFPDLTSSRKYNKQAVMYYLTESTLLTTKEVRDAMKRYKLLYMIVKEDYVRNIYHNKEE